MKSNSRKRVLIFTDYYLPGYKAGGPIRSIHNLVNSLNKEFHFLIITRDRDLGSDGPYNSIKVDEWNRFDHTSVFYASPDVLTFRGIRNVIHNLKFDLVCLNSFFSPTFTGLPLMLFKVYRDNCTPVIVAPRGEFSKGALEIKPFKKRLYIAFVKLIGLYNHVIWQATAMNEMHDIIREFGANESQIEVAPNVLPAYELTAFSKSSDNPSKNSLDRLKIIFLSRISRKKNLDFLIDLLRDVNSPVELKIYGPIEDELYWKECLKIKDQLTGETLVTYCKDIQPQEVPKVFNENDLFVFPTKGENFGHVIYESLSAGTPVLISDQTPWKGESSGVIEVLPLSDRNEWVSIINKWAGYDNEKKQHFKKFSELYAKKYYDENAAIEKNRDLFLKYLN